MARKRYKPEEIVDLLRQAEGRSPATSELNGQRCTAYRNEFPGLGVRAQPCAWWNGGRQGRVLGQFEAHI